MKKIGKFVIPKVPWTHTPLAMKKTGKFVIGETDAKGLEPG